MIDICLHTTWFQLTDNNPKQTIIISSNYKTSNLQLQSIRYSYQMQIIFNHNYLNYKWDPYWLYLSRSEWACE